MIIFRGIVVSLFILILSFAAEAVIVGFSVDRTINRQTANEIIEKARVGERLTAVLPGLIKQDISGPVAQLRNEDIRRFVAEVLTVDQVNALLKPFAGETVEYIRGDRDTVSKIDLAPTEKRAEAAAKKILPGMVGAQFANMIQSQFKNAGLDKGLEIPREQLDATRKAFAQLHFGLKIALTALVIIFLLIFAIAPHGLSGRLRWCGATLIIAGYMSALAASLALAAREFIARFAFGGNAPLEIKDLLKDAAVILSKIIAQNIFIGAALCIGGGAALVVLGYVLRKRSALTETAPEANDLASL